MRRDRGTFRSDRGAFRAHATDRPQETTPGSGSNGTVAHRSFAELVSARVPNVHGPNHRGATRKVRPGFGGPLLEGWR
jgi:hypothetical protein